MDDRAPITELYNRLLAGDRSVEQELWPLIHNQLRVVARSLERRERHDPNATGSSLVNHAYIRVATSLPVAQNRQHLLHLFTRVMRQILIDEANSRMTAKRSGENIPLPADIAATAFGSGLGRFSPEAWAIVHNALDVLASEMPDAANILQQKHFIGLTLAELADVHGRSVSFVHRQYKAAEERLKDLLKKF